MSPRVKICGVTRLQDAELAVELGAWAIGMVFFQASPRRCSLEEALRITTALRRRVELCGVFVNAPLEQVVGTAEELGLTLLQLHGDEGPAFCAQAGHRTGAAVVKAMQVATVGDVRDVERFPVDYHLLDTRPASRGPRAASEGPAAAHGPRPASGPPVGKEPSAVEELRGGTGETFDWELLAARRSTIPLILSGGLAPENVAEAIAATSRIGRRATPFALDTASGTEAAPGRKDPERMRAFFATVQGAAAVSTPA
jgi:phosphoribosylanthranilate isomerase